MGRFKLGRLARAATAGAAGNPLGTIKAMTQQPPMTPAQIVLAALEDDVVQQALADFTVEVVGAMQGAEARSVAERAASPHAPEPGSAGPPRDKWPYSILSLPAVEQRIEQSEGKRLDVHLVAGKRHVGIGHLVEGDPELEHMQVGERISEELCAELFEDDLEDARMRAESGARRNGCDLPGFPDPVAAALVNMHFQMGVKPTRWSGMWRHLKAGDYAEAARESLRSGLVPGKPSGWWLQTAGRAAVVAPMLSNRQLWFEIGPGETFGDGKSGPSVIEHPWSGA
ncbi:MAG: hypothetical protein OXH59_05460 [Rhodospirillaceae bacterium]|nr:hypothetical protein [Rhodospirillaceae bacterium]